jgi:hypothetical protein
MDGEDQTGPRKRKRDINKRFRIRRKREQDKKKKRLPRCTEDEGKSRTCW